jgi:hypothetical protein
MQPSTMPSTSSVILFPDRPFGPSDQKPKRIGVVRPPWHNLPEGVHYLRPQGLNLTMPVGFGYRCVEFLVRVHYGLLMSALGRSHCLIEGVGAVVIGHRLVSLRLSRTPKCW